MNLIVLLVVFVAIQENGYAVPFINQNIIELLDPEDQKRVEEALQKYKNFLCEESDTVQDCNTCTCSFGILFCTQMPCDTVPKDLWGFMHLNDESRSAALFGRLMGEVKWDLIETVEKNSDKENRVGLGELFALRFTKNERPDLGLAILKQPCTQKQWLMAQKFCQMFN